MVSSIHTPFPRRFRALTSYEPFPWQCELYLRLLQGNIPQVCDIPTGLGKTSVIPVWIIAAADRLSEGSGASFPRRLIYIVNRRTVVDQATDEAMRLRARLSRFVEVGAEDAEILGAIRDRLLAASAFHEGPLLAISTLRGELADNAEWKLDPSRPAILIGTIDMIGSKLLFSGYGDSLRRRPHHAGLIGQDAWFVHDEAHLVPAFSALLREVRTIQVTGGEPRPIWVTDLSATPASGSDVLSLSQSDLDDPRVCQRLQARKGLHFHEARPEALAEVLASLAAAHEGRQCRVLIYACQPEIARKVHTALVRRVGEGRVALLTGTLRGYERDLLVEGNKVFRSFREEPESLDATVYLVSTSAGEVGLNLDADHMVCDLSPLDSMIQRLGRVNRYGRRAAKVDIVVPRPTQGADVKNDYQRALTITEQQLRGLRKLPDGGYDASPRALRELGELGVGKTPPAAAAPLRDIDLDAWSLTSLREELPGRKRVAAWLHGIGGDPPETFLAWRAEVAWFWKREATVGQVRAWFDSCPILSRERLREPTERLVGKLDDFARRRAGEEIPAVVLEPSGEARLAELREILRSSAALQYSTLVLPAQLGGLDEAGAFDPSANRPLSQMDVAEVDGSLVRYLIHEADGECRYRRLLEEGEEASTPAELQDLVNELAEQEETASKGLFPIGPDNEEEQEGVGRWHLLLLRRRIPDALSPGIPSSRQPPLLEEHTRRVVEWAQRITRALALPESLAAAVVEAARWHDRGKDRTRWQRAAGNPGEAPWAKPGGNGMIAGLLAGYRHELGSLLDAHRAPELHAHPERELILHLIAAHHGRARPQFEPEAWDSERYSTGDNQEAVWEAMCRFARLQRRFGWWGLAWLEALVRCADALASRDEVGGES